MAYIRIKKINDTPYAYLVESRNTKQGPRQKVKQYLGRVHEFGSSGNAEYSLKVESKKDVLLNLVVPLLLRRGFVEDKGKFSNGNVSFCSKKLTILKGTKNQVIKASDGYLCEFTLKKLLRFRKSNDIGKDGTTLAKYFMEAGLDVSEEDFVRFYEFL